MFSVLEVEFDSSIVISKVISHGSMQWNLGYLLGRILLYLIVLPSLFLREATSAIDFVAN